MAVLVTEVVRSSEPYRRARQQINVVIVGLLGQGVAASLREDPQAKSHGERCRAVSAVVPAALLPELISAEP